MKFITIGIPGDSESFLQFESRSLDVQTFSIDLLGAICISGWQRDYVVTWLGSNLWGHHQTVSRGNTHSILMEDSEFLDPSFIEDVKTFFKKTWIN